MSLFIFRFNNPTKAAESGAPYGIIADFTFGERIKINTGIKIKFKHFNPNYGGNLTKIVKPTIQQDGINRVQKIQEFESVFERMNEGYQLFIKGSLPQCSNLKEAIEYYIHSGTIYENNLVEKFTEFVEAKKKEKLESRTISAYSRVLNILQDIVQENRSISFDVFDLNENFFFLFQNYASDKNWNSTTYNKYLKYFKIGIEWIEKRYYTRRMNSYYKDVSWMPEESNVFFLTETEVRAFADFNFILPGHKLEQEMFLFQMALGRRHSDLIALSKSLDYYIPEEKRLLIINKKGKTTIDLIVPEIAQQTLEKYLKKGRLPLISNQKRNEHLKEMFKLLKLTRKIQVKKFDMKSNQPVTEVMLIEDLVSTHWARSTMVTYLTDQGVQNHVISLITGQNESTIKKYQGNNTENLIILNKEKINPLFNNKLKKGE